MSKAERQQLIDQASRTLREAGFNVVSIMATDTDGTPFTSISCNLKKVSGSRVKRGLGKGFGDIHEGAAVPEKLL